jgi:riboflavin synthase
MFTGIVSSAEIESIETVEGGLRLCIRFPGDFPSCKLGDSIAIDGACLSVVKIRGSQYYFFVSPETIDKTIIQHYRAGRLVNCELPLLPTDRLGGHYVLGHVDGLGRIVSIEKEEAWILDVERNQSDGEFG